MVHERIGMRRILLLIAFISIIATVIVVIASLVTKAQQAKVVVTSFPQDIQLTVNGVDVGSKHQFYTSANSLNIQAQREGFATKLYYLDSLSKSDTNDLLIELEPVSDEAKKWAADNAAEYRTLENKASEISTESQDDLIEEHPIVEKLPFQNNLFSIGYVRDEEGNLEITIRAPDDYIPYAINKIKQWGYDPAELTIRYVNQGNPFDE